MFLFISVVVLILIAIFIVLYFFAPHLEIMHAFKTTKSFVITMVVLLGVSLYLIGIHFNGLNEGNWRTSWPYETEINEQSVTYAGTKTKVGIVLNGIPKEDTPYESEILTWKSYNELEIKATRKWGAGEPITMLLKGSTSEQAPFRYPVTINFPKDGKWKISVIGDGTNLNDIIIQVK